MAFPIDAPVVVKSLGKTGRVVETSRNGRYRVRVGGVLMLCREEDLAEAGTERSGRRAKRGKAQVAVAGTEPGSPPSGAADPAGRDRKRLASIDLHGFTVQEALVKVEERVDLALRAGVERLEVIHGRSSGRIKAAVHRLLRELTAVRHFEIDPRNPGATIVFF
jgi:DNA mismatch repair protein MutS2